ncbi:MAG: phosphatase PAP2 family protein [Calditrichaceae bacterium]
MNFYKIFMLLCILNFSLYAQNSVTSGSITGKIYNDASASLSGMTRVLNSPFKWEKRDWLTFGAVSSGAIAMSLADNEIRDFLKKNRSGFGDSMGRIGRNYGEPLTVIMIAGGIYGYGLFTDNEWARETTVILTTALVPIGLIQVTAERSAGRARPYLELGNHEFDPFRRNEHYRSFLSGHTMVAVSTSLVLAKRINYLPAKVFLYGLGTLGAMARVYEDYHWASDAFLGAALSISSVHFVIRHSDRLKDAGAAESFRWQIYPAKNGFSVSLYW